MYEILELLYDYSMRDKRLDRAFIDRVLEYYWNGLKGYLESIKFESIKQDVKDPNLYIPAAYAFLTKQIVIDEKAIEEAFPYRMLNLQMLHFEGFDRIFAYNVELLRTLLHEIDHAVQFKKGSENIESFEGSLMNLCFYPEIEMFGRSELRKYIYLFFDFMKYSNLGRMYKDLSEKYNHLFGRSSPFERLAHIDSNKQVIGLLEMFNADIKKIPKVLKYYKYELLDFYMQGYDKTQEDQAPTVRYIHGIRDLGYRKLNKVAASVENRFDEITIVDDKIKYGLDVTDKEMSEFKRRILK